MAIREYGLGHHSDGSLYFPTPAQLASMPLRCNLEAGQRSLDGARVHKLGPILNIDVRDADLLSSDVVCVGDPESPLWQTSTVYRLMSIDLPVES